MRPFPKEIEHCERGGVSWTPEVADDDVRVQSPPEVLVEALCPIDIGDGQRHHSSFRSMVPTPGVFIDVSVIGPTAIHADLSQWCGQQRVASNNPSRP